MNTLKLKITGDTHVGQRRTNNEDNLLLGRDLVKKDWSLISSEIVELNNLGSLLVVADGMGGAAAGDVASTLVVNQIKEIFSDLEELPKGDDTILDFLGNVIFNAHHTVVNGTINRPERSGMGTTLVIGLIANTKLYLAWSGDSRAYRYSKIGVPRTKSYDTDNLELLTSDHSMVWEMVEKGKLTAEQARVHPNSNIITQSLGDPMNMPAPDGRIIQLRKGDRIVLCSDGLNSMLPDFEIESILSTVEETSETCEKLIWLANNAGGADNITVIVADVVDGPIGFIAKEEEKPPKKRKSITTKQVLFDEEKKIKKPVKKGRLMPAVLAALSAVLIGIGIWHFGNTNNWFNKNKAGTVQTKKAVGKISDTKEIDPLLAEKERAKNYVLLVDSLRAISYKKFASANKIDQLFSDFDLSNRNSQISISEFPKTEDYAHIENQINELGVISTKLLAEFNNPKPVAKRPKSSTTKAIAKYSIKLPEWEKEYKSLLNRKVKVCQQCNEMTLVDKTELNKLLQQCESLTNYFYEVYDWKTALFLTNNTEILETNFSKISNKVYATEQGLVQLLAATKATDTKIATEVENDTISKQQIASKIDSIPVKNINTNDSIKSTKPIERDTSNQKNN